MRALSFTWVVRVIICARLLLRVSGVCIFVVDVAVIRVFMCVVAFWCCVDVTCGVRMVTFVIVCMCVYVCIYARA